MPTCPLNPSAQSPHKQAIMSSIHLQQDYELLAYRGSDISYRIVHSVQVLYQGTILCKLCTQQI